jgi:hypothetical protein
MLSWIASSDNVAVAGYHVYLDGTRIATTPTTHLAVTGLAPGSTHTLAVDAYDGAANTSVRATLGVTLRPSPPGGGGGPGGAGPTPGGGREKSHGTNAVQTTTQSLARVVRGRVSLRAPSLASHRLVAHLLIGRWHASVVRVVFRLDGRVLRVDHRAPWRATIPLAARTPGRHVLTAVAYDAKGHHRVDSRAFRVRR